jgi:hypothetical protein
MKHRHEWTIQNITEKMKMSRRNLKLTTTNYLNMNKACAELAAEVRGRKLSQTFQQWNNPPSGRETVCGNEK